MAQFTSEQEVLLMDWFRRSRESQRVHYVCASHFSELNLWLGIPSIALSAIAGTAVFTSLQYEAAPLIKIGVGLVAIGAAVFASLQTFLAYSPRADRHREAGAGYGSLRRSFEHLKTFPPAEVSAMEATFSRLKVEMDQLAKSAPEVPARLKERVDKELKSREHRRVFHLTPGGLESDDPT